jgi:Kdo2-lipid IVA lauroyltransferase/acyltransferase
MNRLRLWTEVAAVELALAIARVLPRRGLLALGAVTGTLVGRIDRRHTAIARENLRAAYGDAMPEAERERLLRACWRHFGRITFDALAFPRLDGDAFDAMLEIEGIDNLREALASGRGALVFSAHLGHWEAGGFALRRFGIPHAVVARPLDNPVLERRLDELRGAGGTEIIPKRRAVRETMRALARGLCVGILIDQDAREDGVFVPFFGRLAATTPTLALLALRTEAPIVPLFSRVAADGRISVHIGPAVPTRPTGNRDADVLRLTAACTAVVEGWARRSPEQWLWMHRRWKTRPPGEAEAGA